MIVKSLTLLTFLLAVTVHPRSPAAAQEVQGPVRLIAPRDFPVESPPIRIDARFPPNPKVCPARQPRNLHAAYSGTLEIGRRSDGRLYLVAELTFPEYLEGIAEVPRDWPIDTLKAQVVAARTYAISHMNPSTALARELRFNLCATDSCQVYRGLNVANGAWGEQWRQAVAETTGEILESSGKPASTFYFSTSNGRTYSNSDAFGGSALPYLKPIDEQDDGDSPVRRWTVRMPLVDLAETLKRAGAWGGSRIESISLEGNTVAVSGSGQRATMSIEQFRSRLNTQAVCLTPKRYPTASSAGRPLPQVVPSKWLTLRQDVDDVVIDGEGWGHGVGMVQWGAKGKGDRGMPYHDILGFYYGGLLPVARGEPGSIRVGLAIDIVELRIERTEDVRVEGATLPPGPLLITGGNSIKVERAQPIEPVLQVTHWEGPNQLGQGSPSEYAFELSAPAKVELIFEREGSSTISFGPEPRDRGTRSVAADFSRLVPGDYRVRLRASDGVDTVETESRAVSVIMPSPSPIASPTPSPGSATLESKARDLSGVPIAAGMLLLLGAGGALLISRRSRRKRNAAINQR